MNISKYEEAVMARARTDENLSSLYTPDELMVPPDFIHAPEIICEVVPRTYDPSYRVDVVDIFCSRRACRALAMVSLGQLLHSRPRRIDVRLAPAKFLDTDPDVPLHSRRIPSSLFLQLPPEIDGSADVDGPQLSVNAFRYVKHEPRRHPFLHARSTPLDVWSLPSVEITNSDGFGRLRAHESIAISGFGSLGGISRMINLLLDIGGSSSEQLRFDLESEAGFRGVAPRSHEMRLILPGAFEWLPCADFCCD